jgi:P-type Cu2+ transporter
VRARQSTVTAVAVAVPELSVEASLPTATECAHCGLPLGRRPVVADVEGQRAQFCCYGCVLALQVTRARGESGAAATILVRLGLAIFFAINVMMMSMPTYVPYVYGADAADETSGLFQLLRVLALVLAAPVIGLLGWPILVGAANGLRRGGANTDALIVLGTVAAYALSVANTIRGAGPVYFDTAAMLLVLVTLGRYLEARAKAEAGAAVRATLAPGPVLATRLRNGTSELVSPEALVPGDVVRVGPGDAFPTDGIVLDGMGGVDEAALTGENRPVTKETGSAIAGGTCSIEGLFRVRVTALAAESAAARIAALLAGARRERAPAERLADTVAGVLVPIVVAIALAAGAFWSVRGSLGDGLLIGLAVLVVACPCGLGIATPIAVWTALVTAARQGVIVRSPAALERAARIRHVLFDKTGTLTERTPCLVSVECAPGSGLSPEELTARAAALENGINHPLARAIAGVTLLDPDTVGAVRVVPGRGIRGIINGTPIAIGSPRFAAEDRLNIGAQYREYDGSIVLVWAPGQLLGALRFDEAVRTDAAPAIFALRRQGLGVEMVSGDTGAGAVVPALIASHDAALGLSPEDKLAHVRTARQRGNVAMVGDGINDAPALAAADLGVAVGCATDLARMTADVAIVSDDLRRVPWLLDYAHRVTAVIRQNLFWAFAYNAGAVAMAAAGTLNPLVASLAMLASSLAVVANARRLRHG